MSRQIATYQYANDPDVVFREVELRERYDRYAEGWRHNRGMGPRYVGKIHKLIVYQNESLFDKLVRRVPWEHWGSFLAQIDEDNWLSWDDQPLRPPQPTAENTRLLVNDWQTRLFAGGEGNTGIFILRHDDPNFWNQFTSRRRVPRVAFQRPTRGGRMA